MIINIIDFLRTRLKKIFKEKGWKKIIAFQTRNPLHKAHVEMISRSMKDLDAKLLLHPVVGETKPGDIDHFTRVRCYEHVIKKYPKGFFYFISTTTCNENGWA